MVARVPGGLLAVRTGTASGLVVVDIDPDHGGRLDPVLMTPTRCVRTGSGGWHLYYVHPGQPVWSRPLPGRVGVDIKADGGYVVAPPSTHPRTHQPYRWVGTRPVEEMAPALRAACLTTPTVPRPEPRPTRPTTLRAAGAISNPTALLDANLRAVAHAPKGRRRTTLYGAARGVARMVAVGAIGAIGASDAIAALSAAGREAEQTDRQIRDAIAGGFHDEGVAA